MSSNTGNINQLTNIIKPRNKNLGLNLNADQSSIAAPSNLKSEIVIIPSTSQPNWRSYFIIDVKERNCIISDIIIQFNISQVTGTTTPPTNYPQFVPATYFLNKVELVINNVTIDTLYPLQLWISQQFLNDDEDRVLINNMQGNYASVTQRYALSNATASNYFIKLRSFFNETNLPILCDAHQLQIRCYTESYQNVVEKSTGGGTPTGGTNNFVNAIAKIPKLPSEIAQNTLALMGKFVSLKNYRNLIK